MGKKWKRKGSDNAKGGPPLLSVGIIFKNEIRCLERCMKSLQPLRRAIPCQLVMADTGSDDGSRGIAEKYADTLFDFPWIDDFSAARNAVFDRCKGKWTLVIDCDEWLDDITELLDFLKRADFPSFAPLNAGMVIQRNYKSEDMESLYMDALPDRLFRMRDRPRYVGAIHECVVFADAEPKVVRLSRTVLRHDGYLNMASESGKAKRMRNVELLRKELEREPNNLRCLFQYMESGYDQPDYLDKMRLGMELSERKEENWDLYGPQIFSYAVEAAFENNLPQGEEWARKAEELFPDLYRTRIHIHFWRCVWAYNRKDYQESVRLGEDYLKANAAFSTDKRALDESRIGVFYLHAEPYEQSVRAILLYSYLRLGKKTEAREMLNAMNLSRMQMPSISIALNALAELQRDTEDNLAPFALSLWDGLDTPASSDETPEKRKETFLRVGEFILNESLHDGARCPAYALFAPLAGKCPLGDKAALMASQDPDTLSEILSRQDIPSLPAPVLLHAISYGAEFPLPDRPMSPEEMETLCQALCGEGDAFVSLALDCAQADFAADWQSLLWTDSLLFAALDACDWTADPRRDELFRAFAAVERTFLERYYAPDALQSLRILPYRHRFGWHCAKAVELLDAEDFAGAVSNLGDALKQDERMKPVTEFALDEIVRREREAHTPPELLGMAERIRQILTSLPPDDPEVRSLKESPVYRQLKRLIET